MARSCKNGRLKQPVRTAAGGTRFCKKRPTRGRRRSRAKKGGRKCKVFGMVMTKSGARTACASYKRSASTFNPAEQLKSRNWIPGGRFVSASDHKAMRREARQQAKVSVSRNGGSKVKSGGGRKVHGFWSPTPRRSSGASQNWGMHL